MPKTTDGYKRHAATVLKNMNKGKRKIYVQPVHHVKTEMYNGIMNRITNK